MCKVIASTKTDPKLAELFKDVKGAKDRFVEKLKFMEKSFTAAAETLKKENRTAWEPVEAYLIETGKLPKDYDYTKQSITFDRRTGELDLHVEDDERRQAMEGIKKLLLGLLGGGAPKGMPGLSVLMDDHGDPSHPTIH